jgi:hypothetical protein
MAIPGRDGMAGTVTGGQARFERPDITMSKLSHSRANSAGLQARDQRLLACMSQLEAGFGLLANIHRSARENGKGG